MTSAAFLPDLSTVTDLSLLSSSARTAATALVVAPGVLAALLLLARRSRRKAALALAVAALGGLAATVGARHLLEHVWQPFPDALPDELYTWSGAALVAALAALALAIRAARRRHPLRALAAVLAAVLALVGAAGQVNLHFAAYPTLGSVIGVKGYQEVPAGELTDRRETLPQTPAGSAPLAATWTPPADLPGESVVAHTDIPGATSDFPARPAIVLAPPAYRTTPRPLLPVLVLIAGQPGGPEDWMTGGQLAPVVHRYAAEHGGLAPVVVVVDATGSYLGNTLCVDSWRGKAQTYLTVDVPRWIDEHLQVDTRPGHRAIGGLSFGGTCALQLALDAPRTYPVFLDISGQPEPTLGDRRTTLDQLFDGDDARFRAVNPADRLARERFPDTRGRFVVGEKDEEYRPGLEALCVAARGAGIDADIETIPGGHDYTVWSGGLASQLPWLGAQLGLTEAA